LSQSTRTNLSPRERPEGKKSRGRPRMSSKKRIDRLKYISCMQVPLVPCP
jgi:hypothetical protein